MSTNKFTFTGHEKDEETGLIYAKARFYDPDVGRFLSQDSYLGDVTNVPSLHRFVYANANPIRFIDPTGQASFEHADIEKVREELSNFYPSTDDPTKGKVSWAQGNAGGMRNPSEALQFLLDQYGSKNAANTALDAWEQAGSSFIAMVKLEPDDFNDGDEVRADKVFGEFIQEVGTNALELPFLRRNFLKMLNGATKSSSHDISGVFSDAYSISALRAYEEATLARAPNGQYVDESEMHPYARGGRTLTRFLVTTPSLLNQGLEGRAPRDFKTKFGLLTALEAFPFVKSAGSLTWRLLTRGRALAALEVQGGRAVFGQATRSNYRRTFFDANPELEGDVVVHHAVERQTLKRYPDTVTEAEIHSLENLRGIPKASNPDLHLSKIRKEWNRFYREHPNPTKQQLLDKATEIDREYGSQFRPPVKR